jgi:hypothetical protein
VKKHNIKLAWALLVTFGAGFSNSFNAAPATAHEQTSENCLEASKTSDSLVTSVAKILCREEYANEEFFGALLNQADNYSGGPGQDFDEKDLPKFPTQSNPERYPSTKPKRPAKANSDKIHKAGKGHFVQSDKPHTKKITTRGAKDGERHHAHPIAREKVDLDGFFWGRAYHQLSPAEQMILRGRLDALLTRKEVVAFLIAIQKAEGGELLMIVGGLRGKSADCQRRIRKLKLSGRPKEQGLPNRCFLTTRFGLSTAAGLYQILFYANWRHMKQPLGLKSFAGKYQARAALELVRTSKVKDGKLGEGLEALIRGDLERAIRKGTDPWASSPYSRWRGKHPAPLLKYARQELKKLRNESYARREIARLRHDTNT